MIDKHGNQIEVGNDTIDDDVLFDGKHYWRIYVAQDGSIEMVGFGYLHNITQDALKDFERIGKYHDNDHLMVVD